MDTLLRATRKLLLLLFLSALALGLLKSSTASGEGGFETLIALGISIFVLWQLGRMLRRLSPRRERRSHARPELPARGQWVGPRARDYERER